MALTKFAELDTDQVNTKPVTYIDFFIKSLRKLFKILKISQLTENRNICYIYMYIPSYLHFFYKIWEIEFLFLEN